MREPLKISLTLDLIEIMDVVESLPEGHSLIPMLQGKARVLLAAERMQKAARKIEQAKNHETWCRLNRKHGNNFCTCLKTRGGK